jgi:hypothetical protein
MVPDHSARWNVVRARQNVEGKPLDMAHCISRSKLDSQLCLTKHFPRWPILLMWNYERQKNLFCCVPKRKSMHVEVNEKSAVVVSLAKIISSGRMEEDL